MSQHTFQTWGRESYNDSPEWIKTKKATINPKNKDNKYSQYEVTVALGYGENK